MRLSKALAQKIVRSIELSFGHVDVYLFGSRTDDAKKGGDIDIAIDSKLAESDFKKAKTKLGLYLMNNDLEELCLDITQLSTVTGLFYDEIEHTKIKLNKC